MANRLLWMIWRQKMSIEDLGTTDVDCAIAREAEDGEHW